MVRPTEQEERRVFIYRKHLSDWLSSRLHTVVLPPLLSWSETWGWRMKLGWGWGGGGGWRSVFLIKGQRVEKGQKTGRGLWATSLVRPCFLWTSSLSIRRGAWSFGGRFCRGSIFARFLEPSNLGGRTVALLIAGSDTEDDGWLGGVVDVGVGETGWLHQARGVGSTIHAHEG